MLQEFDRIGNDLQNDGLLFGLGGGVVTVFAPEAGVGELGIGYGASVYEIGSIFLNASSITKLVLFNGDGSGYVLDQLNGALLNNVPEALRNFVDSAVSAAEKKAGLDSGDKGTCK